MHLQYIGAAAGGGDLRRAVTDGGVAEADAVVVLSSSSGEVSLLSLLEVGFLESTAGIGPVCDRRRRRGGLAEWGLSLRPLPLNSFGNKQIKPRKSLAAVAEDGGIQADAHTLAALVLLEDVVARSARSGAHPPLHVLGAVQRPETVQVANHLLAKLGEWLAASGWSGAG